MLEVWLFPIFDVLVYPLFWFPTTLSLSIVSALTGILMIWLYWLTSDQWRMAYEKRRIKVAQNKLMRGNYSGENISDLVFGNLRLTWTAMVPAVVTVLLILLMIPWVGSRFGYFVPEVREPVHVTVESSEDWSVSGGSELRTTIVSSKTDPDKKIIRLFGLDDGRHPLYLKIDGSKKVAIETSTGWSNPPIWPDFGQPQWYHSIVKPGGLTLQNNQPIQSVHVDYRSAFGWLGFTFFGTFIPGWLSYFFVLSFIVGVYFKFHYSIE